MWRHTIATLFSMTSLLVGEARGYAPSCAYRAKPVCPTSVVGTWDYDASHAVTNWLYSGADPALPGRTIIRDPMGLKSREDVLSGALPQPSVTRRAANTFNAADRLMAAQVAVGTNSIHETYSYDGCGALTNVARSAGTNDCYSYDLAGRMLSATASNLDFQASYDALGNRIRTTVKDVTHLWVVDQTDPLKRPLMETTTNGTPVRYYIWGAGMLLAQIDADGTVRYAHCDDQGSVVALTAGDGTVLYSASYGPYGEPWGSAGVNPSPFGWLGGHGVLHAGSSSLYLTRHRAYDTTLRRFLSQDPLGLAGGGNLYSYGSCNPLSYIDPFGLCSTDQYGSSIRASTWQDSLGVALSYGEETVKRAGGLGLSMFTGLFTGPYDASQAFADDPTWGNGLRWGLATAMSISGVIAPLTTMEGAAVSGEARAAAINPAAIRFSQSSVSEVDGIAASMRADGWQGPPIDVVRMDDGALTAFDNTRVLAASRAGIDVQAVIREAAEAFPAGRWTPRSGIQPTTWEQAVQVRIQQQNRLFRQTYPNGSPIVGSAK